MRILLIGYGKMGKTIEQIALQRNHSMVARIDQDNADVWETLNGDSVDVAIEFSQPDAAVANIRHCLRRGIPIVSGTTGWLAHREEIETFCREQGGTFFYASNFSIGVNLFFRLNAQLAKLIGDYPQYQASVEETHHTEKLDAPSGTAITIAEGMLEHLPLTNWVLQETEQDRSAAQLPIQAKREPDVPGTHLVRYQSAEDTIEIKHTAHSRKGFALGAVVVAEWIVQQQKSGVLTMNDFLK
ncbi:4-hydroxy-tetrahydrodipicolinate reductase [Tunicatimonas pelagia]|uniref:4-hydroxy-tetrahydrodipicolinate reductase n=1 Tax=Tunicatimonas pelagia TaxID=931531 RepID=UPI002666C700|nr:4-hydroxy-tetrahydrodipicolinate reductase [Tunicatimonas pelagia]WKN40590.1 4-hydroxy-tetrahydrodipicolinate reductase [Tunicatimonas pelagia]